MEEQKEHEAAPASQPEGNYKVRNPSAVPPFVRASNKVDNNRPHQLRKGSPRTGRHGRYKSPRPKERAGTTTKAEEKEKEKEEEEEKEKEKEKAEDQDTAKAGEEATAPKAKAKATTATTQEPTFATTAKSLDTTKPTAD